ncbi:hypothetical protein [Rhizobium sp. SL86]|uniref:hypothetical protein n=1 Tax=Rhizobium sp. SL86 TaxID=2995148 RepID=UPI00227560F4|nr:hypothetical protein [Rhizobium sp. SL86]MCY1668961.1 hypothetical protein [Rhizobium sp. SL86]
MADSDNSRTLPVVTRRRLLSVSATWLAGLVGGVGEGLHFAGGRNDRADPALMLWQEWWSVHELVEKLCRKQQRLETALIAAVGFPHVEIALPDKGCVVAAFSAEEIDRRFAGLPEDAEEKATAVLADRQAAWDALDERLGYSRAKRAEEEAFALRAERLDGLFAMRACSVAGVAAKLHAVLAMGEEGPADEFPWPQIRAAMTDLLSLTSGPSGV